MTVERQPEQRGPNGEILVERIPVDGPIEGGRIVVVTLNRPEAFNASNEPLHTEISLLWSELDADATTAAIVITGAGEAFCGGGDLNLLQRMVDDTALRQATMDEGAVIVRTMTAVRAPIIAAVNGPAVGLGCSLTGMCDVVLVEEQAYFSDPHVPLGLVAADGGALMWPLLTGLLRAKEHILLGDRVDAEEAARIGIANRVVAKGTSRDEAIALATKLAKLPPQAVRESKKLLNNAVHRAIGEILDVALARETESFDEPAFQANLDRMLNRKK
jgi:enoyl-CoA hydratase